MAAEDMPTPLYAYCPDEKCQHKIYFNPEEEKIWCYHCGQTTERAFIADVQEIENYEELPFALKQLFSRCSMPKRSADMVKVRGLSHFHAKLLSPFLTTHGMKRNSTQAIPLKEMDNPREFFDCSKLAIYSFLIDPREIGIEGYGKDRSGGYEYLGEILDLIKQENGGRENLIPLHADGDGHCLVHAISRALIGRELFWHPLRCHLKRHLIEYQREYKKILKDCLSGDADWCKIVDECDPDYIPVNEELGLQQYHILGLANVLKRPIILLDAVIKGHSSGVYLPIMVPPNECKNKSGEFYSPICIAWNNAAHNHFIPLVAVRGEGDLPRLPAKIMPEVWVVPKHHLYDYIPTLQDKGYCEIGYGLNLKEDYILRLTQAMNVVFQNNYGFHPILAADYSFYCQRLEYMLTNYQRLQSARTGAQRAVTAGRLFRCSNCHSLYELQVNASHLKPGSFYYSEACKANNSRDTPNPEQAYLFYLYSEKAALTCTYDVEEDSLFILFFSKWCPYCKAIVFYRRVMPNGAIMYINGDKTQSPSRVCKCSFKHFWNGKEYDNLPQRIHVDVIWRPYRLQDIVFYFQNESDSSLNSNSERLAGQLVSKHFPNLIDISYLSQKVQYQIVEKAADIKNTLLSHDYLSMPDDVLAQIKLDKSKHPEENVVPKTQKTILAPSSLEATEKKLKRPLRAIGSEREEQAARSSRPKVKPPHPKHQDDKSSKERSPSPTPSPTPQPSTIRLGQSLASTHVKVRTSNNKTDYLPIKGTDSLSYGKLQAWIEKTFGIPPSCQKISGGCPPLLKKLKTYCLTEDLGLKPGDTIWVDIISPPNLEAPGNGEGGAQMDFALLTFVMEAAKAHLTVWEYAKMHPDYFNHGGLFYRQAQRDVGPLTANKHLTLPFFISKVFRYNQAEDRLELCMEPHGHYAITPKLDTVISQMQQVRQGPGFSVLLPKRDECDNK